MLDTILGAGEQHTVKVELDDRSYPIHIGAGLLNEAPGLIREAFGNVRCIIITDSHLSSIYAQKLHANMARLGLCKDEPLVIPAGEQAKTFSYLSFILDHLFQKTIDRKTMLVALGGGVMGDLVGFAASIALRGIDFIQIPTTLLAQVDSSVGGKTAINSPRGKNLIGAFHQPRMVIADVDTLKTLPSRELRSGYAEVVKYGLISNPEFFDWLDEKGKNLLAGKTEKQIRAIKTSCEMKAAIVAQDERESTGKRALLNLGHTFGHAFELMANYDASLLHGEAVAIGMAKAFELSTRLGLCPERDTQRVKEHLKSVNLPISIQGRNWDTDKILAHMYRDKKAENGHLNFILTRGIGQAFVQEHVVASDVKAVLDMP
ncbi:MAG: 3-dehydroquinate synthase [Alphaproteobacteria bacterium]|nr:3-dehydroquinate synthase [Alphaproteobacteria bacterium]